MVTRHAANLLGCWPTIDQERLLRAATFDRTEALDAWRRWLASVDVENVDAGSFRLLPLLYRNLSRYQVNDPLMAQLKGVHRQSWYRNQLLFRRTAAILRALNDDGIATLILKGIPLSLLYYKDDAVRPMADADILVRVAAGPRVVELLQQHGWRSHRPLPSWRGQGPLREWHTPRPMCRSAGTRVRSCAYNAWRRCGFLLLRRRVSKLRIACPSAVRV